MASEPRHHNTSDQNVVSEPTPFERPLLIEQKNTDGDSRWQRFRSWYIDRKKWSIPATVLLVLLLLAGIPFTRYSLAGLVLKRNISLQVLDSTAHTPVSGATVSLGAISAETDGSGKATLRHVKVGHHKVSLTKKYYQVRTLDLLTPITSQKSIPILTLTATGRQVKVMVTNRINKSPLRDVNIKVAGTTAKTDKNGNAIIVLPVGENDQTGTLSLDGYNDAEVTIKVSGDKIQDNLFTLTPSGKVYFLSKLTGKINVVKTNLDGSGRKTVLAGTGKEDDQNTVLLTSRDWKYLALLSKRAGSKPTLYLIDTSNDSLSTIEEGSIDFSLAGWVGDSFVYTLTRGDTQLWQPGRQILKSFNAPTKKLSTIDQTTASGSGQFDYITELIGNVYAYNDQIFYIKNWSSSFEGPSMSQLSSKQATFNSAKPDGSGKKAIRSFSLASGTSAIDITLEERVENPDTVSLKFSDGTKDNFYIYANGQVKNDSNMTSNNFYTANYSTYLQSPSGNQTFWSESRDGKNTLFIGDEAGQNGKQIATLSDYFTYGWYSDDYLLVSKNSSELYIMSKSATNVVKISDYHKPVQTYAGYGGGYGGI